MTVDSMLAYCLGLPGTWPDSHMENVHPVVKVGEAERGKIFAVLQDEWVGVKVARTQEEADEWLQRFPEHVRVMPYLGRSGWITLDLGDAIPEQDLRDAVDESYRLVVAKLPKRLRTDGWDAV